MRVIYAALMVAAMVCFSGAALAAAGDCDGNGVVDEADQQALMAALNTQTDGSSMDNCDYNGDGAIGLDDVGAHLRQSN